MAPHQDQARQLDPPGPGANQPAPVWSFGSDRLEAFKHPISLSTSQSERLPADFELLVKIDSSSQVQLDGLWDEITLAAKSTQKGGLGQRTLTL
ncbi:hypothetical protein PtB15_3B702 [Puccinia triticina]|nr:hypothetical protein PtB15_3B702 [Puccinia triticina]